MVRDLLRLRRDDPVFRAQRPGGLDGAVLGPAAFVLRYFAAAGHDEDRLLLVNLGADLPLSAAPEPLARATRGPPLVAGVVHRRPPVRRPGCAAGHHGRGHPPSRRSRRRPHPNAMTHIRRLQAGTDTDPVQHLVDREWLVTNGLGGYASGSIAGVITRRYHGLLTAALPAPLGRTVMLSHLAEELVLGRRQAMPPDGEPSTPPGSPSFTRCRVSRNFAWRTACPCGATSSPGWSWRSACSCRTSRTPSTSATGCSWPTRTSGWSCGRRCTSAGTTGRSTSRSATRTPSPSPRTGTRSARRSCRSCAW